MDPLLSADILDNTLKKTMFRAVQESHGGWLVIVLICLLSACGGMPPRAPSPAFLPSSATDSLDFMPLDVGDFHAGGLRSISPYFGYGVETGSTFPMRIVIYHIPDPLNKGQRMALGAVHVDKVVIHEFSRKSVFAVSQDGKTLLYMHDQPHFAPDSLKSKPPGLYQYSHDGGDQLIHAEAGLIATPGLKLFMNALEFSRGDPADPESDRYVRTTEGGERLLQPFGGTELHGAAARGLPEKAQQLSQAGADLEARNDRMFTPLHEALWNGHTDTARVLIAQGADVNARIPGPLGWASLHIAVRFDLDDMIDLLLEKGDGITDVNSIAPGGRTPLHLAFDYNKLTVAAHLIGKGADINARTHRQTTPLSLLAGALADERSPDEWAGSQRESLLKLMLAKGADVNAKDDRGYTPLHYAVLNNSIRTAQVLIAHGADDSLLELVRPHERRERMTLRGRINKIMESTQWVR